MKLFTKLFNYVVFSVKKYNIDESHGLKHSMEVLNFASNIYKSEINKNNDIVKHEKIIYVSAILHDMCDKKYVNEEVALHDMSIFLKKDKIVNNDEIEIIKKIISTMSYSKVIVSGFPNLNEYQTAYNIVREADLLCAYDFDRCMIYNIYVKNTDVITAYDEATKLFNNRVFKHFDNNLLTLEYSINEAIKLESIAKERIKIWDDLIKDEK